MRLRFYPRARDGPCCPAWPWRSRRGRRWHKKDFGLRSSKPTGFAGNRFVRRQCVVPCPAPQLIQPPVATPVKEPGKEPGRKRSAAAGDVPQTPEPSPSSKPRRRSARTTAFAPTLSATWVALTRSASFPYLRATGAVNVFTFGSARHSTRRLPKNSPVPRDRAYFRFNYFDNASPDRPGTGDDLHAVRDRNRLAGDEVL